MMSQKLNVKPLLKTTESWMESILFSSRWILAPFYVGLAFSLIVLLIKFASELIHIATHAFTATESEVILGVLALIDLTLTGSLIIIVIFSGYENFVSRIDHGDHADWPELCATVKDTGCSELWVTHGAEEALVHWAHTQGLAARPLHMIGFGDEDEAADETASDGAGA